MPVQRKYNLQPSRRQQEKQPTKTWKTGELPEDGKKAGTIPDDKLRH